MKAANDMRFWLSVLAAAWFTAACAARAGDTIPVFGAARVAVEDADLLKDTVLDLGVLAVTPGEITRVFIGDGLTPGGLEIHPEGCVRDFKDIAVATTNLDMKHYHIAFGPWRFSGDINEFDATWGGSETWMRFVRDTTNAYLSYDFTVGESNTYAFAFNWSFADGAMPALQVSTNLIEGYSTPPPADTVYFRPDVSHVQITYTAPADAETLFFRVFAANRMDTGIYFSYPVNVSGDILATNGAVIAATTNGAVVLSQNSVRALEYDTHGGGGLTASAWLKPDGMAHQLLYNYWTYNFPTNSGTLALKEDVSSATNQLSEDIAAAYATTGSVASVERRLERLEYPETCALYWDPDFVTSNWDADSSVIYVPTDFPTKRLDLVVCDNGISNLYVRLPGWQPARDVEVVICVLRDTGDSVGRASRVQYLNQLLINHTAANNYRLLICDYDSFAKTWSFYPQTLASRPYYGTTSRKDFPSNRPATVEEWLALHPELASP